MSRNIMSATWKPARFERQKKISALIKQLEEQIQQQKLSRSRFASNMIRLRNRVQSRAQKKLEAEQQQAERRLIFKMQELYLQIISTANKDCLQSVLHISRNFVESIDQTKAQHLTSQVKKALEELQIENQTVLCIHPKDFSEIEKQIEVQKLIPLLRLQQTEEIQEGSVQLQLESGCVCFDFQKDWESMEQTLARQVQERLGLEILDLESENAIPL